MKIFLTTLIFVLLLSLLELLISFFKLFFQVSFTGSDQANFLAGDTIGFTWITSGSVSYEVSSEYNYCSDDIVQPAVGGQISLKSGLVDGKRIYSFQAITKPTTGN